MSRRQDFISPEGLRKDGRRTQELRLMNANISILPHTDGSATFELGNTKILATVHGPREAKSSLALHDRASIKINFHAASFSSVSGERRKQVRQDKRLAEYSLALEETLREVIIVTTFPRSEIDIFVEVLNADGSVLAASFNAVVLALMDAGIPMVDYIVAVSVGNIQGQPLLDLNRLEEASNNPSLTIAFLPRTGTIAYLGLEPRLESDKLGAVLDLAKIGSHKLWTILDTQVVKPYVDNMRKRLKIAPVTNLL